ncbi:MAG: PEP-CTERM sorting domain-containing protein [Phycisphaerae bacterium]|jgi:hypothetical protein
MRKRLLKFVFVVLLCCGGLTQAVPVTIAIRGKVTTFGDDTGLLSVIQVGDNFTGTYTYDSATVNSSTYSNIGKYACNPPYGISLSLDGFEFKTNPTKTPAGFEIGIGNDVIPNGTNDFYYVQSLQNSPTNGLDIIGISWSLRDSTHTAISSITLPVTAPVLSVWNYNYVYISGGNSQHGFAIEGIVTYIPEPTTSVLLVIGTFLLRRKR